MKVLFVCSSSQGYIVPFILDQKQILEQKGIKVNLFTINQGGYFGYFKAILKLKKHLSKNHYDIVHAHYGLSGLLATFQSKIPIVVTYHGSDIHQKKSLRFSKLAINRANYNIFVSNRLKIIAGNPKNSSVIPCGVDFNIFKKIDQEEARKNFKLSPKINYVLFSSSFNRSIKNPKLAIEAIKKIKNTELLELKGYSREQVAHLMNAVDICLLTSKDEGSPQFIKEAAACGKWIISTDVGDIREILENYPKVIFIEPNIDNIADAVKHLAQNKIDNNFKGSSLSKYDNKIIVNNLINVYHSLIQ
ncbi:MAG: glycosyltransferase [Brumimicrobium sp.]